MASVVIGNKSAVLSVVVEAELLVYPLRHSGVELLDLIQALITHPSITIVDVDRQIARYAASVRANYNLTLMDSIVVSTAVLSECDVLVGNDKACAQRVTEIPYIYLEEAVKA